MNIPPVDRPSPVRPVAAELASFGNGRVLPTAPVNPTVVSAPEPVSGVINLVNQANKPSEGEAVYTSVSDPIRRGSEAGTVPKDWTITRPEPVKEEVPPPEPISKLLIDHLHKLWQASGQAVSELLADHPNKVAALTPTENTQTGDAVNEVLTYDPVSIAKTAKASTGSSTSGSTTP